MYEIIFYRDRNGRSQIEDQLNELASKAASSKDARIRFRQMTLYIQLLSDCGTKLGSSIAKKLRGDIWELRPGDSRILFFHYSKGRFILLHSFVKKTAKTPQKEIARAMAERDDWLSREG